MNATEWVLLIVVVILVPLGIAVTVTLWSLEQARQRNRGNRSGAVRRVAPPPEPFLFPGEVPSFHERFPLADRSSVEDRDDGAGDGGIGGVGENGGGVAGGEDGDGSGKDESW